MILNELFHNKFNIPPAETIEAGSRKDIDISKDYKKLAIWIEEHCSDFLSVARSCHKFLYRGIRDTKEKAFIGSPRTDRQSVEGNVATSVMQQADKYMSLCGFKALRTNSIFCSSEYYDARNWGAVYMIFPINGFSFGYSKTNTGGTARAYIFPDKFLYKEVLSMIPQSIPDDFWNKKENREIYNIWRKISRAGMGPEIYDNDQIYKLTIELLKYKDILNSVIRNKTILPHVMDIVNRFSTAEGKAKWFVEYNELHNDDLEWPILNIHDLWIHGTYVAIEHKYWKDSLKHVFLDGIE